MALFPQRFIDDLRLQANIVQVVQEYVPLKRVGRTYKGLCPFHSEKTPSFHVDLQPRDQTTVDLNVVGCTVDEALARAERFLDESLLTDHRVVRLIHGVGTGQLKRALAGFLQEHPLVARFATAPPEQGGGGVTVVELKD